MAWLKHSVRPIPLTLVEPSRAVLNWVAEQPLVRQVYLYGSRFWNTHRPDSDFNVAVALVMPSARECREIFMERRAEWEHILTERSGITTRVALAHRRVTPETIAHLKLGCGLLYTRPKVFKHQTDMRRLDLPKPKPFDMFKSDWRDAARL